MKPKSMALIAAGALGLSVLSIAAAFLLLKVNIDIPFLADVAAITGVIAIVAFVNAVSSALGRRR